MENRKNIANPGSALGEAVGKLFEKGVIDCLRETVNSRGCFIGGRRLRNGTQNQYQIDAVIRDKDDNPLVLIEPKYIRYTKHNRDKGSWLCTAHYSLRKTYPTIRKSMAILGGRWSQPSKELMRSFGVQLFEVPFEFMVDVLAQHNVDFGWSEKAPKDQILQEFYTFQDLGDSQLKKISRKLVSEIKDDIIATVENVLDTDMDSLPRRISSIEILAKTDQDEFVFRTFDSVSGALTHLASYAVNTPDLGNLPKPSNE